MSGRGLLERIDRIMAELAKLRAVVAGIRRAMRMRSALAGLNLTGISEGEIAALAGALDACGGRTSRQPPKQTTLGARRANGGQGKAFQKERGAG